MAGADPVHRRPTKQSDVDAIFNAWRAGSNVFAVGDALLMSPRVVSRIQSKLVNGGRFEVKRRGGARRTLWDPALVQVLLDEVDEHADFTLAELRTRLEVRFPGRPIPALSTMWKKLDGELITLKKSSPSPQQRNTPETKEARFQYVIAMTAEAPDTVLVYYDETGYSLFTKRTQARSRRGSPAHVVTPVAQSNVVNILAAVSPIYGLIYHEIAEQTVTAERVLDYLQHLRAQLDERFPAANLLLILDNARIHRPQDVHTLFNGGNRRARFLPQYSPFLNPIEEAFNGLKMQVKHELRMRHEEILGIQHLPWGQKSIRRREILRECLVPSIPQITVEKCGAYYAHCLTFYPACLGHQDIL